MFDIIKVVVDVDADVKSAKKQLQNLQRDLNNLVTSQGGRVQLPLTKELLEADKAVMQLNANLKTAMNPNTGKLDLTKFNQSLKNSGQTIGNLKNQLMKFGPDGEKAFLQLSQSIMRAEVPMKRMGTLSQSLWTSLKNTMKWQIASTVLNGITRGMQNAYRYVEKLDKSLTNIQIVTQKSTNEMQKFAKQANIAAKELSATTTKYTDAALIYYQQGLGDEEVINRTNTTIKMANVLGESAESVSSYMTAIWNNFDNGSKSLEYYGDAIAALGAATASSSAEIAGGLEKFASIGQTVGLSYEYATAALATIVAKTRQSEDVVGTALKTLFSRMQGLKLGKTLEDGTDLNKYSEGLLAVGVNIKDQTGALKDMDVILDEVGQKWGTLAKDQQVALAQTVGGIRQYNQFISLMDNYDQFKVNVGVARNSRGTLETQQSIYEESLEGKKATMTAAAEGLYDSLLNEEFFKSFYEDMAGMLEMFEALADSLGGMKGVISALGYVLTKVFSSQLAKSVDNLMYSIKTGLGVTQVEMNRLREETLANYKAIYQDSTSEGAAQVQVATKRLEVEAEIAKVRHNLTPEQQIFLDSELQLLATQEQELIRLGQELDSQTKITEEITKQAREKATTGNKAITEEAFNSAIQTAHSQINNADEQREIITNFVPPTGPKAAQDFTTEIQKMNAALNKAGISNTKANRKLEQFADQVNSGKKTVEQATQEMKEWAQSNDFVGDSLTNASNGTNSLKNTLREALQQTDLTDQEIDDLANSLLNLNTATHNSTNANNNYAARVEHTKQSVTGLNQVTKSLGQTFVSAARGVSSIVMGINSLSSISDTINDDTLSGWQKFSQIAMSVGFALPGLINGFKSLTFITKLFNIETYKSAVASGQAALSKLRESLAIKKASSAGKQDIITKGAQTVATWMLDLATKSLCVPLLVATAIILSLIATFLIATTVFKAFSTESASEQLENATKAAQEANEALSEAKDAASALTDAFKQYDDVINKLESCTKGTKEWKDALLEVNNVVLDILEKYPELGSMTNEKGELAVQRDKETSQLTIQDWAMEELQNQAFERTLQAQSYQIETQKDVYKAEERADREKIQNELSDQGLYDTATRKVEEYAGKTKHEIREMLMQRGVADAHIDDFADKIMKMQPEILGLANSIDANSEAIDRQNEILVDQMLSDNEIVQESGYAQEVNDLTADFLEAQKETEYQKLVNTESIDDNMSKASGSENEEFQKWFEEWKKATGRTNVVAQDNAVQGTDGNRTFHFKDGDEEFYLTKEQFLKQIASGYASEKVDQYAEGLVKEFTKLDTSGKKDQAALKDILASKNLEAATQSEFEALTKKIGNPSNDNDIKKYLEENIEGGLSPENLEKFGYKTEEEFIEATKQMIIDRDNALNDVLEESIDAVEKRYDTMSENVKELSVGGTKQLTDQMTEAFLTGGEEGLNKFTKVVNKVNKDDMEDFVDFVDTTTDWGNQTPKQLKESMEKAGIATDKFTNEDLANFIDSMQGDTVKSLDEVAASYKEVSEAAGKLKVGDTLDAEKFAKLGTGADEYFTRMADGTYKLTGDAEEFYDFVQGKGVTQYLNNLDNTNKKLGEYNDIAKYDTETVTQKQDGAEKLNQQFNILDAFDTEESTSGQVQQWRDKLAKGILTDEDKETIANAVKENKSSLDGIEQIIEETEKSKLEQEVALGMISEDSAKFEKDLASGKFGNSLSSEAIEKIRENYNNIELYEDLDVEELDNYAEHIQDVAKESEKFDDALITNDNLAKEVAKTYTKTGDAIEELDSKGKDWIKTLSTGTQGTKEYSEATKGLKDNLADLYGVDASNIDDSFIQGNAEDIAKTIAGDAEAAKKIQKELTKEVIENISDSKNQAEGLSNVFDQLGDIGTDMKVGATKELDENLAQSIKNTEASVGEINEILSTLGMKANLDENGNIASLTKLIDTEDIIKDLQTVAEERDKIEELSYKKEIERYTLITKQKELLDTERQRLQTQRERAFGKEKQSFYKQEINAAEKAVRLQEHYLAQIKENYKTDREALNQYGITSNAEGIITNEESTRKAWVDRLNELAEKVNLGQLDKSVYDDEKEKYEKMTEALDQYNETRSALIEGETELIEAQNEVIDSKMELLDFEMENYLKLSEDTKNLIDYQLKVLEGDIYKTANKISLIGQQTANLQGDIAEYERQLAQIDTENLTQAEADKIREIKQSIAETTLEIRELSKEVEETLSGVIEEANEKFDEQSDKIEKLTSLTSSYKNIIDVLGKDRLGIDAEFILQVDTASIDLAINNVTVAQQKLEFLQASQLKLEQELIQAQKEGSEERIEFLTEEIEKIQTQVNEANNEVLDTINSSIEQATNTYKNYISNALQELEKELAGNAGSLEKLQESINKARELEDLFLSDYKQIYEISKLQRDIENSLSTTDNLKAKDELNKLSKELNKIQQDGTKLSEYDLQVLRKKYELKLAEAALTESQNNKSQVKMQRDLEGNWRYVYTVDQEEVEKAEQNYEDKLYEMQELNENYIRTLEDNIIETEKRMLEEINKLDITQFTNKQEYYAKVQEIIAHYQEKYDFYYDQMGNTLKNNLDLYENDYQQYALSTGYKNDADDLFITHFNQTKIAYGLGLTEMEEAQALFTANIGSPDDPESLLGIMDKGYTDWQESVDEILGAAGLSIENYRDKVETAVTTGENSLIKQGEKAKDATIEIKNQMNDLMAGVVTEITGYKTTFCSAIDDMTLKAQELLDKYEDVLAAKGWLDKYENDTKEDDPPPEKDDDIIVDTGANTGPSTPDANTQKFKEVNNQVQSVFDYLDPLAKGTYSNNAVGRNVELLNSKDRPGDIVLYDETGKKLSAAATSSTGQQLFDNQWFVVAEEQLYKDKDGKTYVKAKYTGDNKTMNGGKLENSKYYYIQTQHANAGNYEYYWWDKDGKTARTEKQFKDWDLEKQMKEGRENRENKIRQESNNYANHDALFNEKPAGGYILGTGHGLANDGSGTAYVYNGRKVYTDYELTLKDTKLGKHYSLISSEHSNPSSKEHKPIYDSLQLSGSVNDYTVGEDPVFGEFERINTDLYHEIASPFNAYYPLYRNNQLIYYVHYDDVQLALNEHTKSPLEKFDTGGYTGAWGSEGRLAVLHQKELVLNSKDTENLLSAVNLLRTMALQMEANNLQDKYKNILDTKIGQLKQKDINKDIVQHVSIQASFPTANNRNEIEEAFKNLLNSATQYINQK